ncbi:MAG TPA: response regulator [Polyangiaceae bacterium]|nr:response regulator [Polyangiaceae bacterium]
MSQAAKPAEPGPSAPALTTVHVPEKFAPLFQQAQSYVSRYFADLLSTPERGTLEIHGQRYVLVRAASMSVEFYEMVRSFSREEEEARAVVHALLFDVAHAMGLADAKTFAERMSVSDPIARLSAGPVHFAHAGWAFVDISEESNPAPNEDYYLLYDHPYSFESDSWLAASKNSDCPVCVMNAGYSSGWCEHSFGLSLVAVEILCRAKGDESCRFIMAPPEQIEAHIARYKQQHPELAARIVNYSVPGFFSKRTDRQLLRKNLELEQRERQRAQDLFAINERLKLDKAELSASKELNERLIEALPGGVVQVGKDGALLRANAEALRILGMSYDTLTQRYVGDFATQTIFEDGSPAPVSEYPVTKALVTGLTQPATTMGVRKPNGEIAWAVFRAVPTRDASTQEINGAVVSFFDITERKHFEDKLRHTQKLESLGVLAGGIAHDFNNLLVTILGNASFAKSIASADPRIAPLLDEIEIGARRAAELTKQMLDYAGQGKFKLQQVELSTLVREMAKLVKALIPKHVDVHYQFQEGLPTVDADAAQLRQVAMNLITNAAEAMAERPGRVVLSVEQRHVTESELASYIGDASCAGTFLCLEVRDSGAGMDEDTRSRVFDPFFTTKFRGRGLGMAAVLGIIRSHHGAIRIESQEGAGTRVQVLLPVRSREQASTPTGDHAVRGTVLVVDDDEGVRNLARRALLANGYRVLTAADGTEGVHLFEQHASEIHLVLMDVTMPTMNGFEAIRRIRARESRVPILLSSGYDVGSSDVAHAQLSGILEKPYDMAQLVRAVERALDPNSV